MLSHIPIWLGLDPSNAEATFAQSTKPSKPYCVGIHWIDLAGYSHVSTCSRVSVIFQCLLNYLVLARSATSSIWVNKNSQ